MDGAVIFLRQAEHVPSAPIGDAPLRTKEKHNARKRDKDIICIECHDTGRGMSPEEVRDAFNPFFTTKEPGEGTGLGLYISHETIKKHRGSVNIQSKKGRGTVLSVELPCRRRKS